MSEVDVKFIDDGKVAIVSINRPKKFNSLSWATFSEISKVMEDLNKKDIRCIVFTGVGKHFSAGLDLTSAMDMQALKGEDASRAAFKFYDVVKPL